MKKVLFISIFCLFFVGISHGQKMYSFENLEQSTPENLETYLTFAKKQKKTGAILLKTGLLTAGTGFVVAALSYDNDEWIGINTGTAIGAWMCILGTGAALVGLPILISGSSRIKRINEVISRNSAHFPVEIIPSCFYDNIAQHQQYGATIRIKF